MIRRLHVPELPAAGGRVELPRASVEHASVLRLHPGARVRLFDARLGEADATIVALDRRRGSCESGPREEVQPRMPRVTALLGLPKAGRLETSVRMLTELGVHAIRPVFCQRSVARPVGADARVRRCRRIALEACAQSGQAWAPEVHAPEPLLLAAARMADDERGVVFWEEADAPLDDANLSEGAPAVWVVVGPEGGLAPGEIAALETIGYRQVGLGPQLLRVETAAAVAVALVLDRCGRMRN